MSVSIGAKSGEVGERIELKLCVWVDSEILEL